MDDTRELKEFPHVTSSSKYGYFPLVSSGNAAEIIISEEDYEVVDVAASMLAEDVERVTGILPRRSSASSISEIGGVAVVAGTLGHSSLIDGMVDAGLIDIDGIAGKWEASVVVTMNHPDTQCPILVVAGSDRRGTAFGLTSLSRAIGVSPWYWWADVTPEHKDALYVQSGCYFQAEPDVQYRGIFINDERFGGWANWVEQTFDKESGQVGPKVYEKVFELLLRLRANYLWPAMHNGSRAFNAIPENAILADRYAIVMGSSHCEQMLRNNEDEWKNAGTYGDFNYITNRQTMIDYWEERVRTNGRFENTYTLGLRGIHDYPMEGAATTEQRVALMQQALDDQRAILARNIDKPVEEVPQLLCTYEEVLDAYHSGLVVPEDVTLLWSDDKQGYTRNLSNPEEMKRKGGAGIYYHLSYHGDPASWIWLSPLSPAFVSTELTKAYTFGARKVWIFNVGDIKPAEKEISFVMDLAWDMDRWAPEKASGYIEEWAAETFGKKYASEIASIQASYYRLMASGKDSHVWFVEYPEQEIMDRMQQYREIAGRAEKLAGKIPERLRAAYFELVFYPVKGAQLLNEYQLQSRLSMLHATQGKYQEALEEGRLATEMYEQLDPWTARYNNELLDGKWGHFFDWRPYQWAYTSGMDAPVCTEETVEELKQSPSPGPVPVAEALSDGVVIVSDAEGEIPLWIKARTHVRNFSKAREDNIFCRVECGDDSFDAAATPINNVWHSPMIGPMWSEVGTIHLKKGENLLKICDLEENSSIESIYIGLYHPVPSEPVCRIAAKDFSAKHDSQDGSISVISQLGYSDGVLVLPFDTPSYDVESAPYVEYDVRIPAGSCRMEIRTLPTLHVYEGRDARYAVQLDDEPVQVFSIHEGDFTSEWRLNVLRGYATRSLEMNAAREGKHKVRVYMLDPGIVLQEIVVSAD